MLCQAYVFSRSCTSMCIPIEKAVPFVSCLQLRRFGLLWRSMRFPGIICRVFGNTLFGAYAIRRAVMPYHYNIT